jgi:hypothetical protein
MHVGKRTLHKANAAGQNEGKIIVRLLTLLTFAILLSACSEDLPLAGQTAQVPNEDTLYQTSTLAALSAGVYDGDLTISELKKHALRCGHPF